MDNVEELNPQYVLLTQRIKYNEKKFGSQETYKSVLENLLEDSKYIALSLRFPYKDYSNMDIPSKYNNWQIRCCLELYELIGTANIKAYAENGLSWTRDSASLSNSLVQEIEPIVGYIEEKIEEETENV